MTSRERRSDVVAKSMGELLLKGYKMLSTSCEICNNVLLQDRQGMITCVNCNGDGNHNKMSPMEESHGRNNRTADPSDRSSNPTESAEIFLMMEITSASQSLEALPPGADLQLKQKYIGHILMCAQTIQALRMIK